MLAQRDSRLFQQPLSRLFFGLFVLAGPAHWHCQADLIVVENSGFEDTSIGTPLNEFTFGAPAGWSLYDPGNITSGGAGPSFYVGTLTPNPPVNYLQGAPEGQRVGIAFNFFGTGNQDEYGLQQTLGNFLQANSRYHLSVEIGNIASGTAQNGTFFNLDGFPGYRKARSSGGWEIELTGRASKSGSDAHNLWLSDQRIKSVAGYLYAQLSSVPFILVPRAIGESSPYDGDEYEHELDRSVEVIATFRSVKPRRITKPTLLIPKVHPWRRPVNRKVQDFKLQVLKADVAVTTLDLSTGVVSFGRGDARVKLLIQIDEVGSLDYALFEYQGLGQGTILSGTASLKKAKLGLDLSRFSAIYNSGDVHPFATDVEMDAEDFGGPALFQFNVRGSVFRFGPQTGLFGPDTRIRNLSFGMTLDENLLQYAEGQTFGDMKLVKSIPEWAK